MKATVEIFRYWIWYVSPNTKLLPIARKLFFLAISGKINPLTLDLEQADV